MPFPGCRDRPPGGARSPMATPSERTAQLAAVAAPRRHSRQHLELARMPRRSPRLSRARTRFLRCGATRGCQNSAPRHRLAVELALCRVPAPPWTWAPAQPGTLESAAASWSPPPRRRRRDRVLRARATLSHRARRLDDGLGVRRSARRRGPARSRARWPGPEVRPRLHPGPRIASVRARRAPAARSRPR